MTPHTYDKMPTLPANSPEGAALFYFLFIVYFFKEHVHFQEEEELAFIPHFCPS